ncbi:MAG: alpha/beta fold hydrolase [Steroidobacteraceae bacterium]
MSADNLPEIGSVVTTEIEGLAIRYARTGASNGVPILMTAPWPESIYAFHRVAPRLRAEHPLFLVDLPGFGRSQSRPAVMAPEAMGDFVITLLARFGIAQTFAIAPDVGTLAILFAAVKKPDLFISAALGSAAMRPDLAVGTLRNLIHSPIGAFGGSDGAESVKSYLTRAAGLTPGPIIEDFRAASAGPRFEQAVQFVRGYITDLPKLEPQLSGIAMPVLIIAGRSDPIVPPANGQFLADRLPHNRYQLLDAEHRAWEEAAEAYTDALCSWFAGGYRTV